MHEDRPRSGRPRISTDRDDRHLVRQSLANRKATFRSFVGCGKGHGVIASNTNVRTRLMDAGLNAKVARKKPKLTRRHKQLRLDFAREHQDWTWVDWSLVIFTDESRFTLYRNDGRTYVRRRVGEALLPECIASTVKFGGGGGVMVWGALIARGPDLLKPVRDNLNGVRYIDIPGD